MRKSILSSITAVLLAGVLAGGVCATGYASRNEDGKWFKNADLSSWHWSDKTVSNKGDNDGVNEPNSGFINAGENKGIFLASYCLSASDYENYGIDAQANSAYSINATVNEDAVDKSVIGSVAWKDSSSAWAQGKNINDYVELNQTVEYGLNFTLTVKQAFGEPIIVKVVSCMDSGVYGTCQVDYLKELISFDAVLNAEYGDDIGRIKVGDSTNTIQITPNFGEGTVEGTISNYKTTFTTNAYFRTELKSKLDNFTSNIGGAFSPVEKIVMTGKDFKINLQGGSVAGGANGLVVGGGPSPNVIVNNFIVQRGATNVIGTETATAGVVQIKYEITYSYGDDYSKTVTDIEQKGTFGDNPTKLLYAFRSDCLSTISTINSIQVPENIVVLPN